MEQVREVGIPLLAHMNIYEKKEGHHFGITLLWIFTIDLGIERRHIDLTAGIASLYVQMGIGGL